MNNIPPNNVLPQMFDESVNRASKDHASAEFPRESVGLVVSGVYVPVKNIHPDPENHFKIDGRTVAAVARKGKVEAVIHSHNISNDPDTLRTVHPPHPSYNDMFTQLKWNVPFGIQLVNQEGAGGIIWWGDTVPKPGYEGRPYLYGVYDCYSIIRDYYIKDLGIYLKDFARHDGWWIKEDGDNNLYLDNIMAEGFVQIDIKDIQKNDVVLLNIRGVNPNHTIVYLGGSQGLHHLSLNTSKIEDISRYIDPQKSLYHSTWRHKDFIKDEKKNA